MTLSSPVTIASRFSGGSDAPPLTMGTTASSSPSPLSPAPSRSPSLTPPPPIASSSKRKSNGSTSDPKKRAKTGEEDKAEKGTYCHQCRTKCEPEAVLRCTKLKKYTKAQPERACNLAWCERDLKLRFDITAEDVRRSSKKEAGHDEDKGYVFTCPCCLDYCQNSTCRLKKGLPKLGDVVKLSKQTGLSVLNLVAKADAEGAARDLFDGELSDPDAPAPPPKAKKAAKKTPEKKAKAATKGKDVKVKEGKKASKAGKSKDVKGKGKTDKKPAATKKSAKQEKEPKPKRIVQPKVEPPTLRNIETRMGREEAEQRMFVREFIVRFRTLLEITERALGPLDDLDHPLSEATVRTLAGALLDVIIKDGEVHPSLPLATYDYIRERREELRHYADLVRFAQVYNALSEEMSLELPPDPNKEAKERNDRAMRALLDIADGESTPTWATDTGPSRRTAASRVPPPSEVVRMLIALINFVIHIEEFRTEMDVAFDFSVGDLLKTLHQLQREESARWDIQKKKLNAARLEAKNAAETKKAKENYSEQEREHNLQMRSIIVNHRASLVTKQLRFEPLGTDVDGRVYYALTPRRIVEERYRPSGWARGVVFWGRGIEGQNDDMPAIVERWMVVDTAEGVKQLADWVGYRARSASDDMEWEEKEKQKEEMKAKKGKSATTPNGVSLLILPRDGDGDDSDSDLSSVPEESLLQLYSTEGYVPSAETIRNEGTKLETALVETATFLEVVEWRSR